MFKRLIFFGDSFTYGHGLPDCTSSTDRSAPGPRPSLMGYPNMVGRVFGKEVFNYAQPGASNKQISELIAINKLLPGDKVIVQWSYTERDHYLPKANTIKSAPPSAKLDFKGKLYYRYFCIPEDTEHVCALTAELCYDYIINKTGLKPTYWFNGTKEYAFKNLRLDLPYADNFITRTNWLPKGMPITDQAALDKIHPGIRWNRQLSEHLAEWIKRDL